MTQYVYSVWTKPSVELSEDSNAPMKWNELESMVFANPVGTGDTIRVFLDISYGIPGHNLLPDARLYLGKVMEVQQHAAFDGSNASTRLLLERDRADDRFEKFVEKYHAQRSAQQ